VAGAKICVVSRFLFRAVLLCASLWNIILEIQAMSRAWAAIYVVLLGTVSVHLYRFPVYPMDTLGYMGNALLMKHLDPAKIHELVYAEVHKMSERNQEDLLGTQITSDPTADASRQMRAKNVDSSTEFLPCFAIRPLYTQLLYVLSLFVGLRRAAVLISVGSYFLLGILIFAWCQRYVPSYCAAAFCGILMLTTPVTLLGRSTLPDALFTLLAMSALFLIFEVEKLLPGLLLLLVSTFVRTDNVVLVVPVLTVLWFTTRLEFWKAASLGLLSVLSVALINHFAGDYGPAMLFYRNFSGTPSFPADMNLHMSVRVYVSGFRLGIRRMLESPLPGFILLGLVGVYRKSHLRLISAISTTYAGLHFLVLPNWEDRWFVITYLLLALSSICVESRAPGSSSPSSLHPANMS
jgi:hypothetical protein